ncbi:MAG: VCBS domain-containing protein [Pseudomonadota bacterium]
MNKIKHPQAQANKPSLQTRAGSSLVRRRPGILVLEQRLMFDGAAAAEAVAVLADQVFDSSPASAPAPDESSSGGEPASGSSSPSSSEPLPDAGNTLFAIATATQDLPPSVAAAQRDAAQLIDQFLQQPDAASQLFPVFGAGQSAPSAEWLQAANGFLDAWRSGETSVRVELVSGTDLWGSFGAYAAMGPTGEPVIYLNADWIKGGASSLHIAHVLIEEFGHHIDARLNGSVDTIGDEGEAFAARVLNLQPGSDDWARINTEDDRLNIMIDGAEVSVEMISLQFTRVWNVGTNDLEENSLTIGSLLTGTKFIFESDIATDQWFSGNNTRGRLYAVDASNLVIGEYYGEISRLVKNGSTVVGLQFYVYPDSASPGTGTPSQIMLIGVGNWQPPGATVGTSSDPVSGALNKLIPSNSAPVAVADTGIAFESGGENNGTVPLNAIATGTVVGNDTDVDITYGFGATSGTDPLTVTKVINSTAGTTGTPGAGTTSVNGATINGLYGTLTIGANGTNSYAVNNSNATVEALRTNSNTVIDTFTYTISDGKGGKATSTLTITVKGGNDDPIARDDYNIAKESVEPTVPNQYGASDLIGRQAAGNVLTNDADVDAGDGKTVTGLTGSATASAISNTAPDVKLTFVGQTGFNSVSTSSKLYLSIGGVYRQVYDSANNPVSVLSKTEVTANNWSIVLSGTPTKYYDAAGNVTIADMSFLNGKGVGFENSTSTTENVAGMKEATVGTAVTVASATVTLNAASLSGAIASGMSVTGTGVPGGTTITAITYDGSGNASTVTLSNAITSTVGVQLNFSAAAGTTVTGRYGTLAIAANGVYIYTPTANNPALAVGQSAVEQFKYNMMDTATAPSSATLYITVYGSASTDPNAVADTASASEAGGVGNGTAGTNPGGSLLSNDTTPSGSNTLVGAKTPDASTVTALITNSQTAPDNTSWDAKVVGRYGSLFVKADGTYKYFVDNADVNVQALVTGQSLSDIFKYKIQNTGGGIGWADVTISIAGAYDTPVPVADTNSVVSALSNAVGDVLENDSDVDAGDARTVTRVIAGTGSLPGSENVAAASTSVSGYTSVTGTYGTLHIGANGSYTYAVDSSNAAVKALAPGETLASPEVFTYQVKDAGGLVAITTLSITIEGVNDAPVNSVPGGVLSVASGVSLSLAGANLFSSGDVDNNLASVTVAVQSGILATSLAGSSSTGSNQTLVTTLAGGASIYGTENGTENGTSSITFYGTRDQINAALASLTYTSNNGFAGSDTFTITSVDSEALVDTDTKSITVVEGIVQVSSITVNENSPYAVFIVTGAAGQTVTLALQNDSDLLTANAALGTDTAAASSLQYFNGTAWVTYTGAGAVIPAGGELLVRLAISDDANYEGPETFQLSVTNSSNSSFYGTATVVDNGTGAIYPNNTTGAADSNAVLDDDRAVTVTSLTVNENSPYAVFTVTGAIGQAVALGLQSDSDPLTTNALTGTDAGTQLQVLVSGAWVNYDAASLPVIPAGGELLVRLAITDDATSEGAETFQLSVTPTGGLTSYGTATIVDDGSGTIYPNNITGNPDPNAVLDDDRAVTVTSPTVNENSPYAVFTLTGVAGQNLALTLQNDSDSLTANALLGTDTGTQLQVLVDGAWVNYDVASLPVIPAGGQLLVRLAITDDANYEGAETFQLSATPTGGLTSYGTATIVDDGTGSIYPNNTTGSTDSNAVLDDDRAVTVTSPTVNENSPYVVFTLTGAVGQNLALALQNDSDPLTANALLGTDTGTQLQVLVSGAWVNYDAGSLPAIPAGGQLLVRVAITDDANYEGAETFQLSVTPTGGLTSYGTATIIDDGTGSIYPNNITGNPDPNAVLDDDRAVTVTSPTVNENSPYAVFTVTGAAGQNLALALQCDSDPLTANALLGTDTGSQLQVLVNGAWVNYDAASLPVIPAGGQLLVRLAITDDANYEGAETFQLSVTPTGGLTSYGTATIVDDGTGTIYPNNTTGNTDPNAVSDDDRAIQVNSVTVNENSPYAVFTVSGTAGQALSLSLQNDSDVDTANALLGTDSGTQLQVLVSGTWVNYDSASLPVIPAGGELLVRVAITDDVSYEGAETFQLSITPTGGLTAYGTATIVDDGSGSIYPNNTTGNSDPNAVLDDDRAVTVTSPTVNENSPYAVFTVAGVAGQNLALALQNDSDSLTANALLGTDTGAQLQILVDGAWENYDSASLPVIPVGGQLLVRLAITDDVTYEGAETFQLSATPTGGLTSYGTATIIDDGTGTIYPNNITGDPDPNAVLEDDRAIQVTDVTVNENSPYAVFTLTGAAGQEFSLSLQNDNDANTANALPGTDTGTQLQVLVSGSWVNYDAASLPVIPVGGELLVRLAITDDATDEGAEIFQLSVTATGGLTSYGMATIVDDGTGTIYPNNITGNPDLNAVLDDDRAVTVTSPTVNENSPYAVFTVTGAVGQNLALALQNDSDSLTANALLGTETGTQLQVLVSGAWVNYDAASLPVIPAGGQLLVRLAITDDANHEGAETFQLSATPAGGLTSYGIATIVDDGTGTIYPNNTTGNPDPNAVLDDDRTVTVTSLTVNENSPYAVFTVTGVAGQSLALALQNDSDSLTANALMGTDTGSQLQVLVSGTWVNYDAASLPVIPAGGELLVRVAITDDATDEGAETFQLSVTPTGGLTSYGTATIVDDGSGIIYPNNITGNPDPNAVLDDDRAVTVTSPTVNENSPYAVFTVTGVAGQNLALALQNDSDPLTANALLGTDTGMQLQVLVSGAWVNYDAGSLPVIPVGGELLVRVAITDDATDEGTETFQLSVTPTGGLTSYGTATILDDGTGAIYPNNTTGATDSNAVLDDDRAVTVTSLTVNENSPYAVFTVTGAIGQAVALGLQSDSDPLTANALLGTDAGTQLQVLVSGAWVNYDAGSLPVIPAGGQLLVRLAIIDDAASEGAETFQLSVTPTGGLTSFGTATVVDDGTGTIYPNNLTGNPDANAVPDDDRAVTVTSPTVNENSPYAVFTLTGVAGQAVSLSLQNDNDVNTANALLGTDAATQLQVLVNGTWVNYDVASLPVIPAGGQLLVRLAITDDANYEGAETFQLSATPTGGLTSYGTATIVDDGTGSIYPNNTTGSTDSNAVLDDDRAVTVTSPTVNENSPYVVFTLTGAVGQNLALALQNDSDPLTANALLGTDTGTQLQVLVSGAWVNYDAGSLPAIPAGGQLLVRVAITDDANYEGAETFQLSVTPTGGLTSYGTATVVDDGTGSIYPNNITGNPDPNAVLDDDREIQVNSVTINENSPYAVFTVTGVAGQALSLSLQNDNDANTANALLGTDNGTQLQVLVNGAWVNYDSASLPVIPAGGELLVRLAITDDTTYEGPETFQLSVIPTGGLAIYGTATIVDNGSGTIYPDNNTGDPDPDAVPDDDRSISVTGGDYNEGSPWALFTVAANSGQVLGFTLEDVAEAGTTATSGLVSATIHYSLNGGASWSQYTGTPVNAGTDAVLVAVDISAEQDAIYEGVEQFKLVVNSGLPSAAAAFASIVDDGTGTILNVDGTQNTLLAKDDDRPVPVDLIPVPVPVPDLPPVPAAPPIVIEPAPEPARPPIPPFNSTVITTPTPAGADHPVTAVLNDNSLNTYSRLEVAFSDTYTSGNGYRVVVIDAPEPSLKVYNGVTDQFTEAGANASFTLPYDAFVHTNTNEQIALIATLADGQNLPQWLAFDSSTGKFTSNAPENFRGELRIKVTARDGQGKEAVALFRVHVGDKQPGSSGRSSLSDQLRMAAKPPAYMMARVTVPAERASAPRVTFTGS